MQAAALRITLALPALVSALACGAAQPSDPSPVQPIEFMHTVHAAENQVQCAYCHFSAAYSEEAGIPSVSTCMGCHRFIRGSTPEYQEQIALLAGFMADSVSIPWVRVHSVPEFVQFSHKPHVRAGVACAACHGDVAAMERVERVEDLTMGWCLACHRDQDAPDDCAACHY